ncbi:unnamed protein product [Phytomonas sp. EM1]|nr:unnamed protein product [Phytomonas sp. EM1]|eukprot:CCW61058.1 unnamed protein product [Phytomonas sp. isolate EM1]
MVVWFRCSLCARAWRESISSRVARYENKLEKTPRDARGEVIQLCPSCELRGAEGRLETPSTNASDQRNRQASPAHFLSQDLLLMEEVCLRPDQDPSTIPLRSEQVLSWRCRYCGYQFQSSLRKRVACYEGCPQCHGKVCTPMNSLPIQRPDVVREVAKTISRTKLTKLTIFSEQEIPFVCRTCFSPYRMTPKARCMIPKGGVACPKCFLNYSQIASNEAGSESHPRRLTAKKRRELRDKAHRLCLSGRSKEKLEATRNEIEKRDRILIN